MLMADNDSGDMPTPQRPDPHGAAALLLVESLIHSMIHRCTLTHLEALEVVQVAVDAQNEIMHEQADDLKNESDAITLLSAISASLAIDSR
jgi:hypothetical protein